MATCEVELNVSFAEILNKFFPEENILDQRDESIFYVERKDIDAENIPVEDKINKSVNNPIAEEFGAMFCGNTPLIWQHTCSYYLLLSCWRYVS